MTTEKELSNELHHRVDRIDGSPITMDAVVGTAGKIRRRRRAGASIAALAAVAVIVPTAMFGGGLFDKDSAPAPAAPTTTQTSDAVLDPSLPAGDPPKIAYIDGDHVVTESGLTIQLDHNYGTTVRSGDEYLAIRDQSGGEPSIDILDSDWKVTDTLRVDAPAVSSADGTVAAWLAPDGTVTTRSGGETLTLGKVTGEYPQAVAVLGSGSCREDQGGCRVFVNPSQGSPQSADSHGIVDDVFGGFVQVAAVSPDNLIAGLLNWSSGTRPACSAVYDERGDKRLFKTCDIAFNNDAGFSPDGSLLVGTPAEADAGGTRSLEVVDSHTGKTVTRVELAKATNRNTSIVESAWEDDEHLIITTEKTTSDDPASYNIYRVGLDGSVVRMLERDYAGDGGELQPWIFVQ